MATSISEQERRSTSVEQTEAIAAELARSLPVGAVVALSGDLGAGKTVFARGVAQAFHVREPAHSPTFTLINEYHGERTVFHADLYRVADEREAEAIGLPECFDAGGVTLIEWPERAAGLLPARTIYVEIAFGATPTERIIRWRGGEREFAR